MLYHYIFKFYGHCWSFRLCLVERTNVAIIADLLNRRIICSVVQIYRAISPADYLNPFHTYQPYRVQTHTLHTYIHTTCCSISKVYNAFSIHGKASDSMQVGFLLLISINKVGNNYCNLRIINTHTIKLCQYGIMVQEWMEAKLNQCQKRQQQFTFYKMTLNVAQLGNTEFYHCCKFLGQLSSKNNLWFIILCVLYENTIASK